MVRLPKHFDVTGLSWDAARKMLRQYILADVKVVVFGRDWPEEQLDRLISLRYD